MTRDNAIYEHGVSYRMAGHYTRPTKIRFKAEENKNYQLNFVTDTGTA